MLDGLYAVTPDLADTADMLRRAEQVLLGGVRLVQYRNKPADAALRREQAAALLALCRRHGARLVVNDDLPLALSLGADGVHLGREDGDLAAARAVLGAGRLLGVSCYDELERAREAKRVGADYVAFGSFFASPTKPAAVRAPLGLPAAAKAELGLPVCAIGGITLQNAPQLIDAGADLLAVISDLFEAPDIRARAAAYTSLFSERATS
ncbi:MAG: thiamine phosphate synthase [Rhodocyclaceae bacterium]|jgi:thiamine-phosphate pyrophosphorylase|nr:Thiamine-phosphate synthase [Rhodocyclaceae bacterium]MCC6879081.1 thiamine phosphate synthase [Rhodocyclaceae bacterium]MCL4680230.1 thiamine phosphate synthase [Rhodocyclaceae bacterium]